MSTSDLPADRVPVLQAGDLLHICAQYQTSIRKLLWLRVSKDGSLYTRFCAPRTQPMVNFPAEVLPDGSHRFAWDTPEAVEALPNHEHTSFHASGIINSPSERSFSVNLRLLTHRTWLGLYFPRHPSYWPIVESDGEPALVIQNLLDDECPLSLRLYYQPAGELPIIPSDLGKGVFVVPIGYEGVDGHGRVLLHMVFSRQPGARWAPYWTIAWPTVAGSKGRLDNEFWIE